MTPWKTALAALNRMIMTWTLTATLLGAFVGVADVALANVAPIAKAGADQAVNELTPVTFFGSSSIDLDDDPLSYS
jgi:hypothetical protein